ncbi:unnamed protein product [Linum trigynum]|uniref:Uncharacterized protein n=1 Tax=Linum trigynum TaxID=586398 RepID=A0AAV2FDK0_9ROSI
METYETDTTSLATLGRPIKPNINNGRQSRGQGGPNTFRCGGETRSATMSLRRRCLSSLPPLIDLPLILTK